MATTTPNYGWDVPTSTDYVKDGATAIETLGDDIDATLYSVTGGKGVGLQLLNSTDFSASAGINVSNIFSSTYSRYRILISAHVAAGTPLLAMYFRENTTDKGSGYYGGFWQIRFDAVTLGTGMNNQNFITAIPIIGNSAATRSVVSLDVYRTATDGIVTGSGYNGSASGSFNVAANQNSMTNFTGFSLSPASSTMTGSVKVYGYKETV
jgi:hypothetical protein